MDYCTLEEVRTELVKQGAVDVAQHETFSDIRITNTSAETPKYG